MDDLELLLQFLEASGTSSGVGRTLNNLDNPLLGLITGGFDPMTLPASGGRDWSRYAGNPEYPQVQQVIAEIQAGRDPYQLSSYVDALTASGADLDGFQPDDFKNLAMNLQKEYGGGEQGDWLRKAGFGSPLEQYTSETVPMDEASMRRARLAGSTYDQVMRLAKRSSDAARIAEQDVEVKQKRNARSNANDIVDARRSQVSSNAGNRKSEGDENIRKIRAARGAMATTVGKLDKNTEALRKSKGFGGAPKVDESAVRRIQDLRNKDLYNQGQATLWALMAGAEKAGRAQGFADQGITPFKSDLAKRIAALASLGSR